MGGPSDMHEISSDLEKRPESPEASFEKKELRFFPTRILLPVGSLLLGFWFVAVWIFGSTYKQQQKSRNLEVLVADFDGKEIGMYLYYEFIEYGSNQSYLQENAYSRRPRLYLAYPKWFLLFQLQTARFPTMTSMNLFGGNSLPLLRSPFLSASPISLFREGSSLTYAGDTIGVQ